MVKIIFSNGECVEWDDGNFPDKVSISFDPAPQPPVPDRISADHIDSLCNMLEHAVEQWNTHPWTAKKYNQYQITIGHARKRASWLREGKA